MLEELWYNGYVKKLQWQNIHRVNSESGIYMGMCTLTQQIDDKCVSGGAVMVMAEVVEL